MERIPLIRRLYLKLEERFCSAVVEINVKSPGFITFLLLQWFLPFLQLCSLLRDTFAPFHVRLPGEMLDRDISPSSIANTTRWGMQHSEKH